MKATPPPADAAASRATRPGKTRITGRFVRRSPMFQPLQPLLRRAVLAIFAAAPGASLAASHVSAEVAFSLATTPGKLPKTVTPVHYALDLTPDLDKLTFTGSELVDIKVMEPVTRLTLNAVDLTIGTAAVDGEAASEIAFDAAQQTVTFDFARPIAAGRHRLRVAFAGRINRFARGLHHLDYTAAGGQKRMISSHLEPTGARRLFPGWDEPAFKASFALSVTVPQAFLAVSNMPAASEEPAGEGRKRVAFRPTPRMSSYLLVLAAGDLERVSADVGGVTVGVVATRGKTGQAGYALQAAGDLLRYFNDYFGVAYPLPKLDLIAVPGGIAGAMENWGGITFFEPRLLFDPAAGAETARREIFTYIAHEMAHQWFGDLVTLAWWDDVWLNEAFASWMEAKAADALHPDWLAWLNSVYRPAALGEDARRNARPIKQPVRNESEALAAFDSIVYGKGPAVVRMLEGYVGEDAFRTAIRAYVQQHAYSNATTADLWGALQAVSGKPAIAVAAGFVEQGGIPLVIAQTSCAGDAQRVTLRQERFIARDPAPADSSGKAQRWLVPVVRGAADGTGAETVLLDGTAEFAAGRCGGPVKLNLGGTGYYRVQYDAAMYEALAGAIGRLAPADRANLLDDAWALVEAGRATPAAFLDFADRLAGDDNRAVASQIIRALARIDRLQWTRPERAAFQAYGRAALRPLFDRIGWDAAPSESADHALLRTRLIKLLGDFGDEAVAAEAKRRFATFVADPASLPAPLSDTVIGLAGRLADRATYDTLLALARGASSADERLRYYGAAAAARDPALAAETLALTLSDELPASLAGQVISAVASEGEHRDLAWDFVKANFGALAAKQEPSFPDRFPARLLSNFTDAAHAQELAGFSPAQATAAGRALAARAYQRIMADVDLAARLLPAVDAWVKGRMERP